jgi:hypothetical protein
MSLIKAGPRRRRWRKGASAPLGRPAPRHGEARASVLAVLGELDGAPLGAPGVARRVGLSERTALETLKALEAEGIVRRTRRHWRGGPLPVLTWRLVPPPGDAACEPPDGE